MNKLITTVLSLSIFSQLCSMDDPLPPLSSSPSSKGVFSTLSRLVANTTDNLFGHGDGYIDDLIGKQESFRADDMNLTDLLQLTHRGEWGMLEFLKKQDKQKLKQCLDLTDKHTVPLNPAVIMAAKKLLDLDCPGPVFIRQFKDRKVASPDTAESSEETLQTTHLAENAVIQFIQASNPEQLHEVLQLIKKHNIGINPSISSNALKFFHAYQIKCQETILNLVVNIKQAQAFKTAIDEKTQLSQSAIVFNPEEFRKSLNQAVNQK